MPRCDCGTKVSWEEHESSGLCYRCSGKEAADKYAEGFRDGVEAMRKAAIDAAWRSPTPEGPTREAFEIGKAIVNLEIKGP